MSGLSELHSNTLDLLSGPPLFPVEVDLTNSAFQYKSTTPVIAVIYTYTKIILVSDISFFFYRVTQAWVLNVKYLLQQISIIWTFLMLTLCIIDGITVLTRHMWFKIAWKRYLRIMTFSTISGC